MIDGSYIFAFKSYKTKACLKIGRKLFQLPASYFDLIEHFNIQEKRFICLLLHDYDNKLDRQFI
jgi:hypothetical protein